LLRLLRPSNAAASGREQFASARRKSPLLERGEKIPVAVSGGLDLPALPHLLRTPASRQRWKFAVARFNQQLCRRNSGADEESFAPSMFSGE
jgi:tRNA(Ile)-lysidine synthase TilS/MesJ